MADFPIRCVSKPMHSSQNGRGPLIFCKVAEKEVKTGRAGELSLGRPRQSAGSLRRSGCGSGLRACGVQVARAASGGRRREEGGEPRLGGGGGRKEEGALSPVRVLPAAPGQRSELLPGRARGGGGGRGGGA